MYTCGNDLDSKFVFVRFLLYYRLWYLVEKIFSADLEITLGHCMCTSLWYCMAKCSIRPLLVEMFNFVL